jgi:SAM-dependent methyltransferase
LDGKLHVRFGDLGFCDRRLFEHAMNLDPPQAILIAYGEMDFCNPLSPALLDRVLETARLPAGAQALDLGCGNAAMAIHLAEQHGLSVDAIERSSAVAAIAEARLLGRGAPGQVRLHKAASRDFLEGGAQFDLVVCAGASGVVEGPPEPAAIIAALRTHLRPGGFLLWADPFWKRDPDPMFVAMLGGLAAYKTHAENIAAGEAAGLVPYYAGVSSDQDWDDYTWRMTAAVEHWLADHPDDPAAAQVRQRSAFLRMAYIAQGRDALGFGVYLFRAPKTA